MKQAVALGLLLTVGLEFGSAEAGNHDIIQNNLKLRNSSVVESVRSAEEKALAAEKRAIVAEERVKVLEARARRAESRLIILEALIQSCSIVSSKEMSESTRRKHQELRLREDIRGLDRRH